LPQRARAEKVEEEERASTENAEELEERTVSGTQR